MFQSIEPCPKAMSIVPKLFVRERWKAYGLLYAFLTTLFGCSSPPRWQAVHTRLPGAMLSIWGTSERDVYVVGSDTRDGRGPMVLHFDGTRWKRLNTGLTSGDLWWIHGPAPDTIFMVGSGGTILRYHPQLGTFERMNTPGSVTLFGVWGSSPRDVWAVGGNIGGPGGSGPTGVIWHFDGTSWQNVSPLPDDVGSRSALFKVWGRAPNDVWAVGESSTVLHWDGSQWTSVNTNAGGRLFTVHGNGTEQIAVGGAFSGILLEGRGSSWRVVPLDGAPRLNGVFVPANGDPIVCGANGSIFRRRDGQWQLELVDPSLSDDFHSVWIDPSGGVWLAGGQVVETPLSNGMIYHLGSPVPSQTIEQ